MSNKREKFEVYRSRSFWRDFHRNKKEREARMAQRAVRGVSGHDYGALSELQQPGCIVTFVPNRDAPVYTLYQNNGSTVISSDPLSIQPLKGPPSIQPLKGKENIPPLPARRAPPPPISSIGTSTHRCHCTEIVQRALARQKHQLSEDEILLRRLTERNCQNDRAQVSR
jgi:hypothetical protein